MSLLIDMKDEEIDKLLSKVNYSVKQLSVDVQLLRTWLCEQKHLPATRLKENDHFLKYYLSNTKGSLETSKKKLDAYYTAKGLGLQFLDDPLSDRVLNNTDYFQVVMLPNCTPSGGRISIARLTEPCENFEIEPFLKKLVAMIEIRMRKSGTSTGEHYVLDFKNFTPTNIIKVNPITIRDFVKWGEESLPTRISKCILLNCNSYFETAINSIFVPVIKTKLKHRLIVTSEGKEALLKLYPKSILPEEYGGEQQSMDVLNENWKKELEQNREWFQNEYKAKTDESLRVKPLKGNNPYYGAQGSVKKLCID